jgi:hypothetical protein
MDDAVMKKYTSLSSEARHYVQYDQGENSSLRVRRNSPCGRSDRMRSFLICNLQKYEEISWLQIERPGSIPGATRLSEQ